MTKDYSLFILYSLFLMMTHDTLGILGVSETSLASHFSFLSRRGRISVPMPSIKGHEERNIPCLIIWQRDLENLKDVLGGFQVC